MKIVNTNVDQFTVTLPKDTADKLRNMAKDECRSLNSAARYLITKGLESPATANRQL